MTGNLTVLKKSKLISLLKNKLLQVYLLLGYRPLKESWIIITITGPTVATKKDRNSNDCETNVQNDSVAKIIPTNKLFEKSGDGNRRNPPINPKIIDI